MNGTIGKLEYEIDQTTGCFICTSHHTTKKYECPVLRINNRTIRAPRYVYAITKGDIPDGYVIRHTCDNPSCINPDHLIVGTHADNVADCVSRNRNAVGEAHGRAKLTKIDVISIYFSKYTKTSLAKKYNVDRKIISHIWNKKLWLSVTRDFLPFHHKIYIADVA